MDQTAKDIFQAGMSFKRIRETEERTDLIKKRDDRDQIKFDQQQKEREVEIMARKEVAESYINSGMVDEGGNITDQGYQMLSNPEAGNKSTAINSLKGKGENALAYLKAQTEFTGQLSANQTNMKNLQMMAFDKANKSYDNIEKQLGAAEIEVKRGNRSAAATHMADAIQNSIIRVHAEAEGDKVKVWKVADGQKQEPQLMTLEESFALAQDYTRENYTQQAAAHIVAGYESNKDPKTFNLKTPDGEDVRAVQVFKSSGVDYLFFDKTGKVMENAPEDLEQAYKNGWKGTSAKTEKAAADLALVKARKDEVVKRTKYIGAKGTGKDTSKKDRQAWGKDRLKYIDDAMADYDETNPESTPEDRLEAEMQAEDRFNQEQLDWTPVSKNKKTGERMYETPDGERVNKYGKLMKPKTGNDRRSDGTKKSTGFLGEYHKKDGSVSTELSIGVKIDGKETEIPSLVPTLTKAEIAHMVSGKKPTKGIVKKAVAHAKKRISQGKSPFYQEDEDKPVRRK